MLYVQGIFSTGIELVVGATLNVVFLHALSDENLYFAAKFRNLRVWLYFVEAKKGQKNFDLISN